MSCCYLEGSVSLPSYRRSTDEPFQIKSMIVTKALESIKGGGKCFPFDMKTQGGYFWSFNMFIYCNCYITYRIITVKKINIVLSLVLIVSQECPK